MQVTFFLATLLFKILTAPSLLMSDETKVSRTIPFAVKAHTKLQVLPSSLSVIALR
jgi:hypothetical protein